jgi:hypothetical protein
MHLAFKINPNLDRLQGCSLIQPDQLNAAVNCVLEHGSQSIVECP